MKASYVLIGDLLAILLVTIVGFATHKETGLQFLPRMAVLYLPLAISWLALAPWFNLLRATELSKPGQIWRAALAIVFGGPPALVVRGLLLNAPIIPIFALVLVGVAAPSMALWRLIVMLLARRLKPAQ